MTLACSTCGATFPKASAYAPEVDLCTGCGAAVPVEASVAEDRLLLGSHPDLRVSMVDGPPRHIDAWARGGKKLDYWVATQGPDRDDIDVRLTLRIQQGTPDKVAAGMTFRATEAGAYGFRIDANGAFQICHWAGGTLESSLVAWRQTGALRKGLGKHNQLRVVMRGVHMRAFVNDVLVASLHDARHTAGVVRITVEPDDVDAHVAYTQFLVRDASE